MMPLCGSNTRSCAGPSPYLLPPCLASLTWARCATAALLLLQPTQSATCKRGFCQFIYEPIKTVIEAAMNDNKEKLFALLEKLEVRAWVVGYSGRWAGWQTGFRGDPALA